MIWPTPQEYNEAIQNPEFVLRDPELKKGKPELDRLGIPRPITGGFASVYRLRCSGRTWAVRCFLRSAPDRVKRYNAIAKHLEKKCLPYTVPFEFLDEGIRVRNRWFPILKMEWVQGDLLHTYVEKNLRNPNALSTLAQRWVQMVEALQEADIAHGDLQHGNVLVVEGQLRLVDYDGMYVPALKGERSAEFGHPNYQHPHRTENHFGPYLDNFSAWVIYISLLILAKDPALWQDVHGGDECLLFRKSDFNRPETSPLFHKLTQHSEPQIRAMAEELKRLLTLSPDRVPPLNHTRRSHSGTPLWVNDHRQLELFESKFRLSFGGTASDQEPVVVSAEGQGWWEDHKTPMTTPAKHGPLEQRAVIRLSGTFVLPNLKEEVSKLRDQERRVNTVVMLDDGYVLVIRGFGAMLYKLGKEEPLWEIDCPAVSGALAPDGDLLALAGPGRKIRLWDLNQGIHLAEMHGHTADVFSVAFSPDGRYLASASEDKCVRLWRVSDQSPSHVLKGHENYVRSVAFSPDGRWLASGAWDATVRLWSPSSAICRRVLDVRKSAVNSVSFSPSGKLLAVASRDIKVQLWQVSDGKCNRELNGHSERVSCVSFSADGRLLASGSKDSTVRLWRMPDGQCVGELKGHRAEILCLSFSPDGQYLASGSWDKTVRLWRVSDGECLHVIEHHRN